MVRAVVVARDGNLVRRHADELAHLDDLVVLVREEEALLGHQPLLAGPLGLHEHRGLVVDVDGVHHVTDRVLVRPGHDDRLAALDAQLAGGLVEQPDVLVVEQLDGVLHVADRVLVRSGHDDRLAALDAQLAGGLIEQLDVLVVEQLVGGLDAAEAKQQRARGSPEGSRI